MKGFSRVLAISAISASQTIGCSSDPIEPKVPVVTVQIPFTQEAPQVASYAEYEPRTSQIKKEIEEPQQETHLTLQQILASVPSDTLDHIEQNIEKYSPGVSPANIPGHRVIAQCESQKTALECREIAITEFDRVVDQNPADIASCNQVYYTEEQFDECIDDRIKADPQAMSVMQYCRQDVLNCVEKAFQ